MEISIDWGLWFNDWYNAYFISSDNALSTFVVGNNLGNFTMTNSNDYNIQSSLNNNANTTIASVNANIANSSGSELNTAYTNFGTNNLTLEGGIVNQATLNDSTPAKQSANQINVGTSNSVDGVSIAQFLQNNFSQLLQGWRTMLYKCFKRFILPFNNLDDSQRSFNW